MKFWLCVGLCSTVLIHFLAMGAGSWYIVQLDLNRCSSCGKLIVTFGELLENMTAISENIVTDIRQGLSNTTGVREEMSDSTGKAIGHELTTIKNDDDIQVIEIFTIENHLNVYIGLLNSMLCTENLTICLHIDNGVAQTAFDSINSLHSMIDTIPMITLFKYLSTVDLLVTIGIVAFDVSSCRSIFTGFVLYSFFSLGAVIVASFPYFVFCAYDFISLCVPWAHVLTMTSAYIAGIIAYNLTKKEKYSTEQALTKWYLQNIKIT